MDKTFFYLLYLSIKFNLHYVLIHHLLVMYVQHKNAKITYLKKGPTPVSIALKYVL